jgi:hypothetical protein
MPCSSVVCDKPLAVLAVTEYACMSNLMCNGVANGVTRTQGLSKEGMESACTCTPQAHVAYNVLVTKLHSSFPLIIAVVLHH